MSIRDEMEKAAKDASALREALMAYPDVARVGSSLRATVPMDKVNVVWMCYDMARERRHGRDVRALFDRVKARGGEWSAEDVAEMDRLYPTEKQ